MVFLEDATYARIFQAVLKRSKSSDVMISSFYNSLD